MSETLFAATRKGLAVAERRGGKWSLTAMHFLGVHIPNLLVDPRGNGQGEATVYAAVHHGHFGAKMHRSEDGGRTWKEIAAPKYPPKPENAPVVRCPMRGIEIPWSVQMIWCLAADLDQDGGLWAGTIPGGLFHSPDRGESWTLVESLWNLPNRARWMGGGYDYPGIHSIAVDPRPAPPGRSRRVLCAISCGGIWGSDDHGQTWSQRGHGLRSDYSPPGQEYDPEGQDAHILAQCQADPEKLWVQHHNGIFRSVDGSRSWQEITTATVSRFGFACAVHPADGETAWFAPAVKDEARVPVDGKVVVTRTRDGGKSFDVLTRGLPQEHAYDLVYRHGLTVDTRRRPGQRLALASTTGGLWVSEDQGDAWATVSTHLPPIYAVAFG